MTPDEYEVWSARLERRLYWSAWAACAVALACLYLKAKAATITFFGVALVLGTLSGSMNIVTAIGWVMCGYAIFFNGGLLWGYAGPVVATFGYAIHEG